jgi:methyl-accepting chemotaxis protein
MLLQEIKTQDLIRKNKLVFAASFISFILAVITNVSIRQPMPIILSLTIGGSIFIVTLGLLIYFNRFIYFIPYVAVIGLAAMLVTVMFSAKTVSVILLPFFLIVTSSIYAKRLPLILAFGLGLVMQIAYLSNYSDFLHMRLSSVITVYLLFFLITMVLMFQLQVNKTMANEMEKSQEQAIALLEKEKQFEKIISQNSGIIAKNISDIHTQSEEQLQSFDEMNLSLQEISSGMQSQSVSASDITHAVETLNTNIEELSETTNVLRKQTNDTKEASYVGSQTVEKLLEKILTFETSIQVMANTLNNLVNKIDETNSFTSNIQEIASQTNLLALNASIEAARAGESGKGFAVVAEEIRKLSELTSKTANQISDNLSQVNESTNMTKQQMAKNAKEMHSTVEMAKNTLHAFETIDEAVKRLYETVQLVDELTNNIRSSSKNIETSVSEFAAVIEQTTASLQEISASVDNHKHQNLKLLENIKQTNAATENLMEMIKKKQK